HGEVTGAHRLQGVEQLAGVERRDLGEIVCLHLDSGFSADFHDLARGGVWGSSLGRAGAGLSWPARPEVSPRREALRSSISGRAWRSLTASWKLRTRSRATTSSP